MAFHLRAARPDTPELVLGSFFWGWLLDAGVGLPLGVGRGLEATSFVYDDRRAGCVYFNDGSAVTADEAAQMAMVAEWVADYQVSLYDVWLKKTEEQRKAMEEAPFRLYNTPVRRDWVKRARDFAVWARASGGFTVH